MTTTPFTPSLLRNIQEEFNEARSESWQYEGSLSIAVLRNFEFIEELNQYFNISVERFAQTLVGLRIWHPSPEETKLFKKFQKKYDIPLWALEGNALLVSCADDFKLMYKLLEFYKETHPNDTQTTAK